MELHYIFALIIFLFPLAYSPGPGNSFFAAIGAARGVTAAFPALLGYHIATLAVSVLIGMGFGLVFLTQPTVIRYLSIAGSLYVFYIGTIFLRTAIRAGDGSTELGGTSGNVGFMSGAMILVLNPKAYLIIGLLFSQFLSSTNSDFGQVLGISVIFTANNLIAFFIWTLAGASLSRLLAGGNSARSINLIFAVCLFGIAIWLLPSALPL